MYIALYSFGISTSIFAIAISSFAFGLFGGMFIVPLTVMSSVRASFSGIIGSPANEAYFSIDQDGTVYGSIKPLFNDLGKISHENI